MTRRHKSPLIEIDLEIEKTLRKLRKTFRENCSNRNFPVDSVQLLNNSVILENMAGIVNENDPLAQNPEGIVQEERSIREVIAPNDNNSYAYAYLPTQEFNFQIKPSLIQNLPKFHGLSGEDPNRHLQDLFLICSSMKPQGTNTEEVMWKAFVFSLESKAREWFLLQPQHVRCNSWAELCRAFLDKYFPLSKGTELKKEIMGVKQGREENLYEYWMRYQALLNKFPNHSMSKDYLVQYFHDGLLPSERRNITATAGGPLLDMPASKAWSLLEKMAILEQQYAVSEREVKSFHESPHVLSKDVQGLQEQITLLTRSLNQMNVQQHQAAVHNVNASQALVPSSCSNCGSFTHATVGCPQSSTPQEVDAVYNNQQYRQGFSQQNPRYDPFSQTYNPGWRDHPNLRYGGGNSQYNQGSSFAKGGGNYQDPQAASSSRQYQ